MRTALHRREQHPTSVYFFLPREREREEEEEDEEELPLRLRLRELEEELDLERRRRRGGLRFLGGLRRLGGDLRAGGLAPPPLLSSLPRPVSLLGGLRPRRGGLRPPPPLLGGLLPRPPAARPRDLDRDLRDAPPLSRSPPLLSRSPPLLSSVFLTNLNATEMTLPSSCAPSSRLIASSHSSLLPIST